MDEKAMDAHESAKTTVTINGGESTDVLPSVAVIVSVAEVPTRAVSALSMVKSAAAVSQTGDSATL